VCVRAGEIGFALDRMPEKSLGIGLAMLQDPNYTQQVQRAIFPRGSAQDGFQLAFGSVEISSRQKFRGALQLDCVRILCDTGCGASERANKDGRPRESHS
jgi:hypothetical protein